MSARFGLVSPGRDEASFLPIMIESMIRQSVRPECWVIVDDGSSDETARIASEAALAHPWIRVVSRENRGRRSVGPGVIDAFEAGLADLDLRQLDFIGKFDLDLRLPPRYFERLLERFEADPRLGSASGKTWFRGPSGQEFDEGIADDMSVGAAKFYRVECFRDIGGLVREVMWDGIDVHRARMAGWKAGSFADPELRFEHLRPMGSSQHGILTGRMRHGYGQWFMGTGLEFITASAVFRMLRPPRLIGAAAMWWGYVRGMLMRERRYDDLEFRRFLRRYQRTCMLRGKRRAVERFESAGERVWADRYGGSA